MVDTVQTLKDSPEIAFKKSPSRALLSFQNANGYSSIFLEELLCGEKLTFGIGKDPRFKLSSSYPCLPCRLSRAFEF